MWCLSEWHRTGTRLSLLGHPGRVPKASRPQQLCRSVSLCSSRVMLKHSSSEHDGCTELTQTSSGSCISLSKSPTFLERARCPGRLMCEGLSRRLWEQLLCSQQRWEPLKHCMAGAALDSWSCCRIVMLWYFSSLQSEEQLWRNPLPQCLWEVL